MKRMHNCATTRNGETARSWWLALGLLALPWLVHGCRAPLGPVFTPVDPPITWPPPPQPARVRYVGSLGSSSDLKGPASAMESIKHFVVGPDAPERLYGPRDVLSLPEKGCVWIADPGGRCVHLMNLRSRRYLKVTQVGGAQLLAPVGLARGPDDSIYVCDAELAAVYRLDAATGTFLGELTSLEVLQRPVSLYFDETSEELLVVDALEHNIKVFDVTGNVLRIIGGRGREPGKFNYPLDVTESAGTLWVVDTGNHRIQGLTKEGDFVRVIGRAGDGPGCLALPKSVAADSEGHLYVVDARFENVQVFDTQGRLLLFFGGEGSGPGEFWLPTGIDVDSEDRIWLCDMYNRRLQVFDYVRSDKGEEYEEAELQQITDRP